MHHTEIGGWEQSNVQVIVNSYVKKVYSFCLNMFLMRNAHFRLFCCMLITWTFVIQAHVATHPIAPNALQIS